MLLEVCTPNFQSAKNAQDAGAHRIELCEKLEIGGITPSCQLLQNVSNELSIKTYVLIRPRGGDFVYTSEEFKAMKAAIEYSKSLNCDGIVSGVLNLDNTIDILRTKELIELSRPLKFTFHRAFDEVINPFEALLQLIDLGADRVLTSGQQPKAINGLQLLKELKAKIQKDILILPGSGIRPDNAVYFKDAGFKEIHASASKEIDGQLVSDVSTIKAILNAI